MAADVRVGDVGTELVVEVPDEDGEALDVSSASAKTIYLWKPGGSLLTKTAAFDTDGADGLIKYTTESGDLDESGVWHIQGKVTIGTNTWGTDVGSFQVMGNLY